MININVYFMGDDKTKSKIFRYTNYEVKRRLLPILRSNKIIIVNEKERK